MMASPSSSHSLPPSSSLASLPRDIDTISNIKKGHLSITSNFIPSSLTQSLLTDAIELYKLGAYITGKVGGRSESNETLNNEKRKCDICGLFDDAMKYDEQVGEENLEGRETLFDIMGELREILQDELNIELSESMELQYLHYPGIIQRPSTQKQKQDREKKQQRGGGFYKRHYDHTADDDNNELIRKISVLLYLNDDKWDAKKDGGILRAYIKKNQQNNGNNDVEVQDVIPAGGKLVLFDSALVEHEVLPTYKERWAVVGWFMQENKSKSNNNSKVGEKKTKTKKRLQHSSNVDEQSSSKRRSKKKRRRR